MSDISADYKSTLTLLDLSVEYEGNGIDFVIFRPEADMPQVTLGDVIVVTNARVQRYRTYPLSLISHRTTSIRIYTASKIPKPGQSARAALAPASKRDSQPPSADEVAYVSYLHHKIDKGTLPDEHEFEQRVQQSLNVKRKFSLLKDVQEGRFYDLVAHVAQEPYAGLDVVTLYVSDYTENPHFHPQVWQGLADSTPGGGDQYGYTSAVDMPTREWVGPYGKMTLQLSCFEPHASFIRDEVKAGQWVALRNVQIKYGRDGQFLEGFVREERNGTTTKLNVQVLETNDRDTIDPNLKEGIRRWRDYVMKKKKQIKDIKSAQVAGQKRKASMASGQEQQQLNNKERRRLERAAKKEGEKENETQTNHDLRLDLNDQIICETHKAPYSTIGSILEPSVYETTIDNQTTALTMPFTCAKYLARARVVDFFPSSLEDFACARKQNDFDVLSDNGDDSEFSSSSDDEPTPGAHRVWEWRFALQLEDAAPPPNTKKSSPRPRLWVFLDNTEAQCLTGLDATDLRQDSATLSQLRERMFTLWGNLEESQTEKQKMGPAHKGKKRAAEKPQRRLEKPPLGSSDVENEGDDDEKTPVSNKPFACCIKQYGVYGKERGEEGKWVRCFGLFGTKICC
jgi:hypothetical protein